MKSGNFDLDNHKFLSTYRLLHSAVVLLISLCACGASDLPQARQIADKESLPVEVASPQSNGKSVTEASAILEAKFKDNKDLTEAERFEMGKLLVAQQRWDDASEWYCTWLESTPAGELREKISKKAIYCARKAEGWIAPPAKDAYTANLRSLEMVFPLTPPKLMQETLQKLISQYPDRWELLVFCARNSISMGQLSDAEAAIAKAIELGGESAKVSASAARNEIDRRKALNETGKQAAALLKSGKKKDAAVLLGKAWEQNSDAVEYGLKSCQLLVENRDFEDAAALSGKIGNYLAEHPGHPLAKKAPLLAVAAEKSTEADKLRDKMGSAAKSPVSQNHSPTKSASKGTKSSGGSMADKFRSRTQ